MYMAAEGHRLRFCPASAREQLGPGHPPDSVRVFAYPEGTGRATSVNARFLRPRTADTCTGPMLRDIVEFPSGLRRHRICTLTEVARLVPPDLWFHQL